MKTIKNFVLLLLTIATIAGCNQVSYRKTKSGLVYKLFPSDNKDSIIRNGEIVKFQVITKLRDSVMYTSYGKMPAYTRLMPSERSQYNLLAVLPMMKKGDSAVVVQMVDTLMKEGAQLPPSAKKGDRITTTLKIMEVYKTDSIAMIDYNKEMANDRPRQEKEQADQEAKMDADRKEQEKKGYESLEKSGEIANELKAMDAFLASKKIHAQKTGMGTYVTIDQPGTGPTAAVGKYVNVNYTGKLLSTDSTFQTYSYEFPLGMGKVIRGWDEGIQLMNKGAKATLYIPGFLCYGANPPQGSPFKPFEPLKFNIELISISDTPTVKKRM
jgi:FKBP-type peptidyl-prolyl cis-trans isomerase FkpA